MSETKETTVVAEEATTVFLPEGFSVGSRIVGIKPVKRFTFIPPKKDIRREVINKISSSWKAGTKDVVRGLDRAAVYYNEKSEKLIVNEEKKYLPSIIGINKESEQWEARTKDYWADWTLPIGNEGVEIQIGFTPDGSPIDLEGYITYNMCRHTDYVAVTKEELANKEHEKYLFYIVDKSEELQKKRKEFEHMKEVNMEFNKLIVATTDQDKAKVDHILELIGGPDGEGMNIHHLHRDNLAKQMLLEEVKEKYSAKFLKLVKDPNLNIKAFISRAIFAGKMSKHGNSYFIKDEKVGVDLKETIAYLKDNRNQAVVDKLEESVKGFYK